MTVDAIDRYLEQIAREEQADLERQHGQQLLDILKGDADPRPADTLLQAIARAHQAKLEEKSEKH